ncbi:RHS repeat-associated core domain-containing protein [Catenovulum sediminis]|uniref:RHS repeat-associated core domain-containing protein n=1 Tax=Catenovulum sediminis TaxID=1740262 RepID=A0ABV1RC92_9ALTE
MVEQFVYDPWGHKQAIVKGSTASNYILGTVTTRGYAGHEGIDHLSLIHMNGRVYDPIIGRFLQADPHLLGN